MFNEQNMRNHYNKDSPCLLLLEDGSFFLGIGFGFFNQFGLNGNQIWATEPAKLCGELCFNTAMSGYQEVLSDPSYAGQVVCFSFPHIGNVGCNDEDYESKQPHALAMITREYPTYPSNWRSNNSLSAWLEKYQISGISGIDTRALIHRIRKHGSQRVLLGQPSVELLDSHSLKAGVLPVLLQHLCNIPFMVGSNLASQVSRQEQHSYRCIISEKWLPPNNPKNFGIEEKQHRQEHLTLDRTHYHIAVLDLGAKENILNSLHYLRTKITIFPLDSSWEEIISIVPSGLLLSNGPGDPEPVYDIIQPMLQKVLAARLPIFGICLGHQVLALSLGAKTLHMHHGHRGINHPVLNISCGTIEITSQNHGFCVGEASLPEGIEVTHRSLFDSSIEGIRSLEYPAFSVQYHPEASPGPHDSLYLFHDFINLMENNSNVL